MTEQRRYDLMDAEVLPGVDVARPMTVAVVALLIAATGCVGGDDTTGTTTSSTLPATPTTVTTTLTTTSATRTPTTTTATTTVSVPPLLEVTDPQPAAVVTTAVCAFQGFTDPGCTVMVSGRYFADVDADGAWTLDLVLRPGGNTTTITAADKNGVKTAVQVTVTYAPVVLRSDGLGIVDL